MNAQRNNAKKQKNAQKRVQRVDFHPLLKQKAKNSEVAKKSKECREFKESKKAKNAKNAKKKKRRKKFNECRNAKTEEIPRFLGMHRTQRM